MSLAARFRAYLGSAEFAVSAAAIVVALTAGAVAFETLPGEINGYIVVLLAGVGVPSIYENQWPVDYENRTTAVAWALGACVALLATYVVLATVLAMVLGDFPASAIAFTAAWLLGVVVAQRVGNR